MGKLYNLISDAVIHIDRYLGGSIADTSKEKAEKQKEIEDFLKDKYVTINGKKCYKSLVLSGRRY